MFDLAKFFVFQYLNVILNGDFKLNICVQVIIKSGWLSKSQWCSLTKKGFNEIFLKLPLTNNGDWLSSICP